jgi:hypothetical protein
MSPFAADIVVVGGVEPPRHQDRSGEDGNGQQQSIRIGADSF